jgi:hypothetical protein
VSACAICPSTSNTYWSNELEVALVERPQSQDDVDLRTAAHITRTEEVDSPG